MTEGERALLNQYRRLHNENQRLREANANLRVERDAADVLLGAAMDQLLENSDRPKGRS
jgi:hypothetical protein